jgi:hypothetical protein
MFRITPQLIADIGTFGLNGNYPIVYFPIDYIFGDVDTCTAYYADKETKFHLVITWGDDVLTTLYCKIVDDTMRITTVLHKHLQWPKKSLKVTEH